MQNEHEVVPIGKLVRELGLTTRTLRYWEEVGFIQSVPRADGGARGYTPYYVRRIKFIIKLKELGLSIKEMQHLYAMYGEAEETKQMIPVLVEILDQHIERVDEKMANLASVRKGLVSYRQRMQTKFNLP